MGREYATILWQRAGDRPESVYGSELEAEAAIEADIFESASSASPEPTDDLKAAAIRAKAEGGSKSRGTGKAKRRDEERCRIKAGVAKRAPKYVVMVGMAGAGKSTFSRTLEATGC